MKNNVQQIHDFGQSIWLDFIDRKIMNSGELKKLIEEDGVRGITSNPAIFEKAISSSDDYTADIAKLLEKEQSNDRIFYGVAIQDIKRAADLFKPVYEEEPRGSDGFVSLEVSPFLARNTAGTISQAKELWQVVDRENVMIKIPGTAEGLPAIKDLHQRRDQYKRDTALCTAALRRSYRSIYFRVGRACKKRTAH
jgi:transaldolase/transaldolase/glucose-6-phosphate isomerase